MADFRGLEDKIEMLTKSLSELRVISSNPSVLRPPTVVSSSTKSILDVRPLDTEILNVVATIRPVAVDPAAPLAPSTSTSRNSRPPPMPTFSGTDFPLWLKRWSRWAKLAGLDSLDEDSARAWFIHAMEEPVLTVVEGFYDRTRTLHELIDATSRIFPTYVTDLSLRKEISDLHPLSHDPTLEEVESLLLKIEGLWSRMTDDAFSD